MKTSDACVRWNNYRAIYSLGLGHADKREREKSWCHRADGREKSGFEWVFHPLVGEWNRQPIATCVASEDTAELIHFALH
jgi:hypothetical protein